MENPAVTTALTRLDALAQENPALLEAARFYQRLIPILDELGRQVPTLVMDPMLLRQKMANGTPLLVGQKLEFDPAQVRRIFKAICSAVQATGATPEAKPGAAGQRAGDILRAVDRGVLDPPALVAAGGRGQPEAAAAAAARLGLDLPLLDLVVQNSLKVFLRAWRENLEGQVKLEEWRRRPCPFCGAEAGLAEIRGVESARFLRCLRCGSGWPYDYLSCAFCGNDDHRSLGILRVEEQIVKLYLHTCDRCRRYIKTVVSFEPLAPDLLTVLDLATLSLDRLAVENGFESTVRGENGGIRL